MAEKGFGVRELIVLGSGTPTITSPGDLNLISNTLGISADVTIGGKIGLGNPVDYGTANQVLTSNGPSAAPTWEDVSGGVNSFTGLTDTPANYTNSGGKLVAVNSGASALEFIDASTVGGTTYTLPASGNPSAVTVTLTGSDSTTDPVTITAGNNISFNTISAGGFTIASTGGVNSFTGLTDTPANYTNSGGKLVAVNSGASALEFIDASTVGATDVTVNYTGRSAPCTLPITVSEPTTGTKQINIPSNSNAFGAKYVQNTEPTGNTICDGDIWYDTSPSSGGVFVTGMIMMFSGTTAPTGWVLCDNSTEAQAANAPDLRDKFIVATGSSYNLNDTGGSADATLPTHTHGDGTLSAANHRHIFPGDDHLGFADGVAGWTDATAGSFNMDADSTSNGNGKMWYTTYSGSLDVSGSTASEGVSATNANLPPYYALAFIMKT
jgi:hypothetical protein